MKNKVIKILFKISFLPYILILLYGLGSAFWGLSFFFNTCYGFEAFALTVLFCLYFFTLMIPIIPVCLIFQIFYILKHRVKKFQTINTKKFFKIGLIIVCIVVIPLLISTYSFQIESFFQKISAKNMSKNADEKIAYNKNNYLYDVIFNMPEYIHDHILIDYDKKEIGILMYSGYDEFWKVKLTKTSSDSTEYKHIINDYIVQAEISLNYPGKKLITFSPNQNITHITIAFLLIYEDGTMYLVDNVKEDGQYTGLDLLKYEKQDIDYVE